VVHNKKMTIPQSYLVGPSLLPAVVATILPMFALLMAGYLLFFIPMLIFMVWMVFSMYVVLFDKKVGMQAIVRSREYIRGRFWSVVGHLGIVGSISFSFIYASRRFPILELLQLLFLPLMLIYFYLVFQKLKTLAVVEKGKQIDNQRLRRNFYFLIGFFVLVTVCVFLPMWLKGK
jgi:hypothetical protein